MLPTFNLYCSRQILQKKNELIDDDIEIVNFWYELVTYKSPNET